MTTNLFRLFIWYAASGIFLWFACDPWARQDFIEARMAHKAPLTRWSGYVLAHASGIVLWPIELLKIARAYLRARARQ